MVIEDIKNAVNSAAGDRQKIAMFHFQILKNAKELEGVNPKAMCKDLGVPASYWIEFQKMISLARLMEEHGVSLAGLS